MECHLSAAFAPGPLCCITRVCKGNWSLSLKGLVAAGDTSKLVPYVEEAKFDGRGRWATGLSKLLLVEHVISTQNPLASQSGRPSQLVQHPSVNKTSPAVVLFPLRADRHSIKITKYHIF